MPGPVETVGDEAAPPRLAANHTHDDLRVAAFVTLALAVAGAVLGPVWALWSGPQQEAYVISPGQLYPFDEVETMAAADGRYFAIVAALGLLVPLFVWWVRPANRGPLMVIALVVGGIAGSVLTAWVGYLTGGGTYSGHRGTIIKHLPLSLHMHGLVFVESAIATLLYGLFVAFAARDDLNRPDPVRARVLSVGVGDQPQDGWGDSDGAGPAQQGDFPAQ